MSRQPRASIAAQAASNRERIEALSAVAGEFSAFRPAREVIGRVQAVPTIFPQLDHRIGVGGFPIARLTVIHGPSNEGKSTLQLGLLRSFLERGHFAAFADAEHSTPEPYARLLVGEAYDYPSFSAIPVTDYEATREGVKDWANRIGTARDKGRIPPDTTGIVVIDSIRALVPKDAFDEMVKAAKAAKAQEQADAEEAKKRGRRAPPKKEDGAGRRLAQLKAAYNAAWIDELLPLLARTRTAAVLIGREKVTKGEGLYSRDVVELMGGENMKFGPSLRLRVERSSIVEDTEDGERVFIGERHRVGVLKTKIAGKREITPLAWFHTSNGVDAPEGFDRARDVLELALELGVAKQNGSHYSASGAKLGQGERAALRKLRADVELLARVEAECRAGAK